MKQIIKSFTLITSTIVVPIIGGSSVTIAKENTKRPNIIYILADDLGYGDLGCYGQKIIKTPRIDQMAKSSLCFTQHYAGCSVSAPSRSSLLTGLDTGHTPIRGNLEYEDEGQQPLPDNTITMASILKDAGYVTGAFGKWGLGYPGSCGDPNKMGFDTFFGYNCQRLAHNYYPYHLWKNQTKILIPENAGIENGIYSQDLIQKEALDFIQKNKDNSFFAFLPFVLPHAELSVPKDDPMYKYYESIFQDEKYYAGWNVDENGISKSGGYCAVKHPHAMFAAMITRLDSYVGEILDKLKELGIEENTIVIFTSDNGPHAEGGADPKFFTSSGNFRGIKRDLYEGGIRVPMIVSWPKMIKKGSNTDLVSAFWDVLPTLEDCAGIKKSNNIDGISFYPTLTGKGKQQKHDFLYWEFHEGGGKVAVRYKDWKGIKLHYGKNPNAPMELYNLSNDPKEENNVASLHPDIVKKIESIMTSEHTYSPLFNFER